MPAVSAVPPQPACMLTGERCASRVISMRQVRACAGPCMFVHATRHLVAAFATSVLSQCPTQTCVLNASGISEGPWPTELGIWSASQGTSSVLDCCRGVLQPQSWQLVAFEFRAAESGRHSARLSCVLNNSQVSNFSRVLKSCQVRSQ